ncbi:MAG: YihY family inner membrane protein [Neisseria sp.]|nr:YihY family inner membrane protein [Neisseria sp.]
MPISVNDLLTALRENRYVAFALFLLRRFQAFNLSQVAASLTYTTLLALVPFFTIALIVIKAFPMFADLTERFNRLITTILVPSGVSSVQGYLQEFAGKAGNLTVIGLLVLGASAILLMMTIEKTFNNIWQVRRQRPLLFRLLMYWTVLTLGPICIGVMSSVWAFVFRPSDFFADYPQLANLLFTATSIAFYSILLTFLYRVVPYRYVPLQHALLGGFLTAIVFEAVRRAFGFYVGHFNSYELIYGAFAAVPLFLLWIFCLWSVLLGGAVLTAGLSHWQGEAFRRYTAGGRHGRLNDAVQILSLLQQAQQAGRMLKIQDFRGKVNLGYDALGDMLDQLERAGLIAHSGNDWVLQTHAEKIMMNDLFRRFVYRPPLAGQDEIANGIRELLLPLQDNLDLSLADFLQQRARKEKPRDLP